ncbi:MAG: hypothetical protein HYR73_05305 [Candidatus Eisenbacteria bacterium]|nr:hypothetical protein [Candidatus Eisenbacteria bacterium]
MRVGAGTPATGFGRIAAAAAWLVAAAAAAITAYVSVRRVVRAPERRRVMRPDPVLTLSHVSALLTLVLGPASLATAMLLGYRAPWIASVPSLAPALLGAALAIAGARRGAPLLLGIESVGARARRGARAAFRTVTALERRLVDTLGRAFRAVAAPLWELHTGDAQEYLLFVVGLSVLALVLPFLR